MADIILTVDASSLTDANKKLRDFGTAVNKFSVLGLSRGITTLQGNIRELVSAQNSGTIGSSAYQLGLLQVKRAYEQMGLSSQAATSAVRKYAAELQRQDAVRIAEQAAKALAKAQQDAAAAAKILADRQLDLRRRFQEGYSLFEQQRKAMRDLREAYRSNIITLQQYQAQLAQIRAGNLTGHINQQAQGMSKITMLTQQAGYQFSDFFVQVQSGTNVLVAFGQQATQLIGTFAMLATSARLVAIFSGIGILVAIGTAIGASLMRASGASKTLKDRLSELSTASSDLKANFDTLKNSGVETKFGNLNTEIKNLTSSMLLLNAASELKSLNTTLDKIKDSASASWMQKAVDLYAGFYTPGTSPEDILKTADEEQFKKYGFSMGRDVFIGLVDGMQKEAKAGNREGVIKLFDQFVADATDAGASVDQITDSGALLVNQLYAVNIALAQSNALLNGSAASSEALLKIEEKRAEVQKNLDNAEAQRMLNGGLSVAAGIQKGIIYDAEVQLRLAKEHSAAVQTAADKSTFLKNVFHALAGEAAAVSVNMSGWPADIDKATARASVLADYMFKISNGIGMMGRVPTVPGGPISVGVGGIVVGSGKDTPGGVKPMPKPDFTVFENLPKGGGGGGSTKDTQSNLEKLQQQLAVEKDLIGTSEAYQKVHSALGEDFKTTSPVVIAGLVAQADQVQRLIDLDNQRKQLLDSVNSTIVDGLMSMVDGTKNAKDAFKSMAADIIKDLYRVLVVQRLVNSISGFFMPAAVPTGVPGSVAPPARPPGLATGGSMMANRAYMVGENGPELVIPRHSGTVVNSSQTARTGNNSGSITVQNNITVTGSDAAMVRTEIAKMIPQITNATKAAVIDAKQRGGQMAAAFR